MASLALSEDMANGAAELRKRRSGSSAALGSRGQLATLGAGHGQESCPTCVHKKNRI